MYCRNCLLGFAFDGDEACLRLLGSGADCPRIGRVSFVP
jgi:hypothetical protein